MPTASGHTRAIRARRVIGTAVKNTSGERVGEVEDVVLDKLSDRIMFAIVGMGGFLGMGEKYHPLPWSALHFDEAADAYVIPYTKDQLMAGPADTIKALTRGDGVAAFHQRIHEHYRLSENRPSENPAQTRQ
jgi:sporulation protein YlmC with PRC-barrel domain